jgi:thiamine biosynthesis lipoprotein
MLELVFGRNKAMLKKRISILFILILAIVVLAVIVIIKMTDNASNLVTMEENPGKLLGTECRIVGVTNQRIDKKKKDALKIAEHFLRDLETKISTSLQDSEISLLNKAITNQKITISESTAEILELSKQIYVKSDGAFDITNKPLITLWQNAEKEGKQPPEDEIATARAISYIDSISVSEDTAWKDSDTTVVDLGRIARGYAAERAVDILQIGGFKGGMVDLDGDMKCFGPSLNSEKWDVVIYNPFDLTKQQILMTLFVTDKGVCTSKDFQITSTVDGKSYSFNIDPRTGYPLDPVPLVTVIADSAAVADAWSTAFSVLGVDGFSKLLKSDGIDAMIVTGSPEKFKITMTAGFESYIKEKLPDDWDVEIIQLEIFPESLIGARNEKRL